MTDPPRLRAGKLALLEFALTEAIPDARRVVDLGGVWGVEGGYGLAAADHSTVDDVVIVDSEEGSETRRRCDAHPHASFRRGLFGDRATAEAVGPHDVTLMFDVLLHQVKPDWDEVLAIYAPLTRAFAIANPQWIDPNDRCVRLLELGPERYFDWIPHGADEAENVRLFERLDEPVDPGGPPLRDLHNLWQWAIPDGALRRVLTDLGFVEVYTHDEGPFCEGSVFHRRNFLFVRQDATEELHRIK